jgi:hypothetical protein
VFTGSSSHCLITHLGPVHPFCRGPTGPTSGLAGKGPPSLDLCGLNRDAALFLVVLWGAPQTTHLLLSALLPHHLSPQTKCQAWLLMFAECSLCPRHDALNSLILLLTTVTEGLPEQLACPSVLNLMSLNPDQFNTALTSHYSRSSNGLQTQAKGPCIPTWAKCHHTPAWGRPLFTELVHTLQLRTEAHHQCTAKVVIRHLGV